MVLRFLLRGANAEQPPHLFVGVHIFLETIKYLTYPLDVLPLLNGNLLAMRTQQSSLRFLTSNSYGISLGVLLTLCIYFRPDHRALSTLQHVSYQTAELDALESRSLSQSNATLLSRDTYQCSASKPCSNGACCGNSGYCGYGPTYCGSGCVSDCNAVAECGQYAKIANTQCPLNTCCSQFGFVSSLILDSTRVKTDTESPQCGTTTDFCGSSSPFRWSLAYLLEHTDLQ